MPMLRTKPCKVCGGVRMYGKTKCYKCIIKEERKKQKLRIAKLKARKQKKREKDHNSYGYLKEKAWKCISLFIRRNGADCNGINSCYTCGVRKHYKELNAGHFHHNKLDFDTRNLKPQCVHCNKFLRGNLAVYATHLMEELGEEGMKQLLKDSNTKTYSCRELKQVIQLYS
jgi:hypothetical protein